MIFEYKWQWDEEYPVAYYRSFCAMLDAITHPLLFVFRIDRRKKKRFRLP